MVRLGTGAAFLSRAGIQMARIVFEQAVAREDRYAGEEQRHRGTDSVRHLTPQKLPRS
jgi:hypothetical protein